MKLHQKILELRAKVGSSPIHRFAPTQSRDKVELRKPKQSSTENERLIKQYFCIFGIPDDYGTVPIKGCFSKSLQERGPASSASSKIPVLWQHKQDEPLCVPSVLIEDEIGLYGEYEPDPIQIGERCIIQVKRGTINNGSYGFNYIWDKMEYDEEKDLIIMKEVNLFEVSPVTIGSQRETFVVRSSDGTYIDECLIDDTEDMIRRVPKTMRMELRSLIDRHISLAKLQPENPLKEVEPSKVAIDYNFLTTNL